MVERHPLGEQEIIAYLRGPIRNSSVSMIASVHDTSKALAAKQYEIWGIQTDSERYWVVASLTNY